MPDKNPGGDRWGGAGLEGSKRSRPEPTVRDLDAGRTGDPGRKDPPRTGDAKKKH